MLSTEVKTLETLFDTLNNHYYDGKLARPVITIASTGNTHSYGWFTVGKVWKDTKTDAKMHEINICAEYLARPIEEVVATLLHEMVHLHCSMNAIKDTSNNGVYHNMRFKTEAEAHGLNISRGRYGWHVTKLSEEAKEFLKEIQACNFSLFRNLPKFSEASVAKGGEEGMEVGVVPTETPKRRTSYRWVCPCCGQIARTTKMSNLVCGDCMKKMVLSN